jgi:hypothetical protein
MHRQIWKEVTLIVSVNRFNKHNPFTLYRIVPVSNLIINLVYVLQLQGKQVQATARQRRPLGAQGTYLPLLLITCTLILKSMLRSRSQFRFSVTSHRV